MCGGRLMFDGASSFNSDLSGWNAEGYMGNYMFGMQADLISLPDCFKPVCPSDYILKYEEPCVWSCFGAFPPPPPLPPPPPHLPGCNDIADFPGTNFRPHISYCQNKAARGDCVSSNANMTAYMMVNCRFSCNLCDGSSPSPPPPSPPPSPPRCTDSSSVCPEYASLGFCSNPAFYATIRSLCRLSCDVCDVYG